MPKINAFLCQDVSDPQNLEQSMSQLRALAGTGDEKEGGKKGIPLVAQL